MARSNVKKLQQKIIPAYDEKVLTEAGLPEEEINHWLNFKLVPIDLIVKAEWNYKSEDPDQQKKLTANLKRVNQIENTHVRLLDTGYYEMINGNHRYDSLLALNKEFVYCYDHGDVSFEEGVRRAIETNETKFQADSQKLSGLVKGLTEEFDLDELLTSLPYSSSEIDVMINSLMDDLDEGAGEAEIVEDPAKIKTKIQPGDLIVIGPHRLICGDSTDPKTIVKLMGGKEATLMVTDPPYGVGVDHSWRDDVKNRTDSPRGGNIEGDDRADWQEVYEHISPQIFYVWHSALHSDTVKANLEDAGMEVRQQIIWVKNVHSLSRSAYHWKHEPCWYGVRKGENANWLGDRKEMTVWEADSPIMSTSHDPDASPHPTQKPLMVFQKLIKNHLSKKGILVDPFLGSGTAMVAAEKLDRTCYAVEITPVFCQITINRMLGLNPDLKITVNGEPYVHEQES